MLSIGRVDSRFPRAFLVLPGWSVQQCTVMLTQHPTAVPSLRVLSALIVMLKVSALKRSSTNTNQWRSASSGDNMSAAIVEVEEEEAAPRLLSKSQFYASCNYAWTHGISCLRFICLRAR